MVTNILWCPITITLFINAVSLGIEKKTVTTVNRNPMKVPAIDAKLASASWASKKFEKISFLTSQIYSGIIKSKIC